MDLIERTKASSLTKVDQEKLHIFIESGLPGVSKLNPKLIEDWFTLFLRGMSAKEIHDQNSVFDIEAILYCQVKYNWDRRREEYVLELHKTTKNRLSQSVLEATSFLTDGMAVAHKMYGEKFRKYLQTGNEKDLPKDMTPNTISSYKKWLESIIKIIEGERPAPIGATVNINTAGGAVTVSEGFTPKQAAKILDIVANGGEDPADEAIEVQAVEVKNKEVKTKKDE